MLGLVERYDIDVGRDFVAMISRTAPCMAQQPPRTIGGLELGVTTASMETPEVRTGEEHEPWALIAAPNQPGIDAQMELDSALIDHNWDELLANVSFDLDPLFGFDMQTPFDSSFA